MASKRAHSRNKKLTGCARVKQEIDKYEAWDSDIMFAIAQAENSTCNPKRHNLTMSENHGSCIGSYGALQVGCIHYKDGEDRNDLATNVKVAYRVWLERRTFAPNGYTAWTMYNNKQYLKYLR